MKKLAIIHYMPLEYYPPIMNFLDSITKLTFDVKVWSSENNKDRISYHNESLKTISRSAFPKANDGSVNRLFKYFKFNITCFFGLLIYRPRIILYYESYSAYPVFLYHFFFGKQTKLYIHYHEYEDKENYRDGMKLVRYYHMLEKNFLYENAEWISQTNSDRLKMFASDHPEVSPNILKIMPNYPPKSWISDFKKVKSKSRSVIKTVYVGALSLKDTFIKEYCDWVVEQNGKVNFHIYAFNLHNDTIEYLENLNSEYIVFHPEGIEYHQMPMVLKNFDIGLILYRAHTNNYKYNAPNKLFEYLACGLKVMYPDVMLGIKSYNSSSVISVDFNKLPHLEFIMEIFSKSNPGDFQFFAEDAFEDMFDKLSIK